MRNKFEGGPAFPVKAENFTDEQVSVFDVEITPGKFVAFGGMTLRDYFAGQVLSTENNVGCPATQAKWAYEVADAMLAERAK